MPYYATLSCSVMWWHDLAWFITRYIIFKNDHNHLERKHLLQSSRKHYLIGDDAKKQISEPGGIRYWIYEQLVCDSDAMYHMGAQTTLRNVLLNLYGFWEQLWVMHMCLGYLLISFLATNSRQASVCEGINEKCISHFDGWVTYSADIVEIG